MIDPKPVYFCWTTITIIVEFIFSVKNGGFNTWPNAAGVETMFHGEKNIHHHKYYRWFSKRKTFWLKPQFLVEKKHASPAASRARCIARCWRRAAAPLLQRWRPRRRRESVSWRRNRAMDLVERTGWGNPFAYDILWFLLLLYKLFDDDIRNYFIMIYYDFLLLLWLLLSLLRMTMMIFFIIMMCITITITKMITLIIIVFYHFYCYLESSSSSLFCHAREFWSPWQGVMELSNSWNLFHGPMAGFLSFSGSGQNLSTWFVHGRTCPTSPFEGILPSWRFPSTCPIHIAVMPVDENRRPPSDINLAW